MKNWVRLKAGPRSLESPSRPMMGPLPRVTWALLVLVGLVTVAILVLSDPGSPDGDPASDDEPRGGNIYHDVGIPLQNLSGEASFFTYESGKAEVRFLVVLDEQGQPHVGLDACDVCYSLGLGFHQEGMEMKCNSCGKSFPISGIGGSNTPGGCWPSYVPFEVSNGFLIISTEYLDSKVYMFE